MVTRVSDTKAPRRESTTPARPLRLAKKALPEDNRRHNRALVLQHLFHGGEMSRADLARESGLTRVTVSDLVGELQNEGIVHELGPRQDAARPGKPATLVEIDDRAFCIATVDLSPDDRFVGALHTLRGESLGRVEQPLDGATGERAIERVLALVAQLVAQAQVPVLGIGVGTPGIVDREGVIREAPNLDWYGVALAERIRRVFDYPVLVANDANAAALGVRTFQRAPGDSLMVVRLEHGVGAGLVIGGTLVEGEQFAAGEIGHVVVDEDGEQCACGRRGCLELAIAAPRLKRRIKESGDGRRDSVLADAGRALGIAISPIISALNLNHVVLSGPAELIEGPFIDATRSTVRVRTMSAVSNGLDVRASGDDENLVLLGAASLVLASALGVS